MKFAYTRSYSQYKVYIKYKHSLGGTYIQLKMVGRRVVKFILFFLGKQWMMLQNFFYCIWVCFLETIVDEYKIIPFINVGLQILWHLIVKAFPGEGFGSCALTFMCTCVFIVVICLEFAFVVLFAL